MIDIYAEPVSKADVKRFLKGPKLQAKVAVRKMRERFMEWPPTDSDDSDYDEELAPVRRSLVRSVCVSVLVFVRLCCSKIRRRKTKGEARNPYSKVRSGWSEIGGRQT